MAWAGSRGRRSKRRAGIGTRRQESTKLASRLPRRETMNKHLEAATAPSNIVLTHFHDVGCSSEGGLISRNVDWVERKVLRPDDANDG